MLPWNYLKLDTNTMIQHMNWEIWNVYDTVFTFFMAIDRDPCESGLVTWLSPID